jgi:hypothetical protein
VNAGQFDRTYMRLWRMMAELTMVSEEYLGTARTLLRVARNMTDQTIANRLKALAEEYERRAQKAELADSAKALSPVAVRGAAAGRSESR